MPNDILRNKATKLKNFTSLKNLKLVEHDLEFFLSSSNDHKTTLISQWENEKKLSKSDTESLRNTVDLLRVTGSNVDLIAAFSKEGISKTEDLITHDKASLAGIMRRNNINAPESKNINSYAEEVLSKAEAEHSSAFFLHRVIEKPELLDLEVSLRPSPSNKLKEFHKNNNTFDLKNEPIISLETGELNVKIQGISKPTPDLIKELSYAQQSLQLSRDTNMAALLFKKEINIRKAAMTTHQTLMRELGIDASAAIEIKQKAQYYHEATVNGFFAYRDIISNPFLRNTLENLKPVKDAIFKGMGKDINWGKVKEINGLKDVDSIEDLFGSQNYCECESCKSVLSPAAYFVDLMRFIEKRVLYQKSGALEVKILQDTHPIHLKVRRPDLWTLKLTCENTNKRIPYIEIVNEAIAAFIEKHLGASKSISERLIEEQPDLEFLLPYNQYLDEVRTWLSYFGLQRLELLEYLYPLPDLNEKLMLAIESLSLSKEQYEIIVNQNLSAKVDTDVLSFRRKSDLNSEDTEQLTKMKFWENKLSIIQKKDTGDIQKYHIEFSSTLTNWQGKLHRLIRLWKFSKWSLEDLDLILHAYDIKHNSLNDAAILNLASFKKIQRLLNLEVDVLVGILKGLEESSLDDLAITWSKILPTDWKTNDEARIDDLLTNSDDDAFNLLLRLQGAFGVNSNDMLACIELLKDTIGTPIPDPSQSQS